jgi:spore coat protein CotH
MDSSYIFDDDTLRTYEIKIDSDLLAFLDNEPMAETYVEGKLVFEGNIIGPVGVRYKGAYGAWMRCINHKRGIHFAGLML